MEPSYPHSYLCSFLYGLLFISGGYIGVCYLDCKEVLECLLQTEPKDKNILGQYTAPKLRVSPIICVINVLDIQG